MMAPPSPQMTMAPTGPPPGIGVDQSMPQPLQPPFMQQEALPIISPLDRWSIREHGKRASELAPDELPDLYDHIIRISDSLGHYWKPRDERMLESQAFWELGARTIDADAEDDDEQASETIEINDGYLTVDKITSMCSGALWQTDVPPGDLGLEDVAQDIEDMLVWADDQLDRKHSLGLHSKLIRDEVHYAALRGWVTGMIVPNPKDQFLPWTYLLEDPLFVYPRYAGDDLIQVVHKYSMSLLEAQTMYDGMEDLFGDKDEDDDVECISYYDPIYRVTFLTEGYSGYTASGVRTMTGDRLVLLPLTAHGYQDLQKNPINPWIIVTPRGTPTRRFSNYTTKSSRREAVAFIGLDVIYPLKNLIIAFERLISMFLTEIAKGVNPPKIIFYDGFNKPEEIDMGTGANNYMIMHSQDAKILESTAMKPDTQPVLQIIQDRMQRGSVPNVLYGQNAGTLAGYAINLLSQGAQDVVQPIMSGVQRFRELRFQRMLEMYVNIGYQFAGPLKFASTDPSTGIRYASGKYIDPMKIMANGTHVDVKYDGVTPRDAVPIVTAAVAANQAGILPLYDAMKDWVGVKDPKAAMRRLAEGMNYHDPAVQKHLARSAGMNSGNADLREAVTATIMEEQMMMAQQQALMAAQAAGGEGSAKGAPNQAGGQVSENSKASPPANQSPITAATNQMNNASAAVNVGNGGSPPNPLAQFLNGG